MTNYKSTTMIKITFCVLLLFSALTLFSQGSTSFATFSLDAAIDDSQIMHAEVSAYPDQENKLHIAWIKTENGVRTVMHTVFNPVSKQFTTTAVDANFHADLKIAPYIITDINNAPYIAYIVKRDTDSGTRNGNFAVMLGSDTDKNDSFTVEQVSTNPNDPTFESDDKYCCYINGRPNIFFDDNNIVVNYLADANTNTSWERYEIFARKSGTSWSRTQEFISDDYGNVAAAKGFSMLPGSPNHMAYIEIGNYTPRFMHKSNGTWSYTEISNYSGTYRNKHAQLVPGSNGTIHYFWFDKDNQNFCHTTLTGNTYSAVKETNIQKTPAGNFYPATIDQTLNTPVYFYRESWGEGRIIFVKADQSSVEYEIPNIGVPYGRKCLFARSGKVFLVTARESDGKIYVTSNTGDNNVGFKNESNLHIEPVKAYPNPASSFIQLSQAGIIKIYNTEGTLLKTEEAKVNHSISITEMDSGIYYIQLRNEKGLSTCSFVKQ
ncbi:T9SS C-terminal target domain-containing protein [Marinilabiliaceae bacterium JC017]|nr:T9SS C-terminal target domain-containing protein [Marinilabiliaceae bacterium JC017]